ncbi:T9SS type A sorting domain-containing protein, partial [Pontibacter sp. CAU 1760]
YAASATKPTLAGSYSVVATLAADNNYEGQASAPFAFAIGKAASTVAVTGDDTFTYNTSAQGPAAVTKTGSTGAVTYSYSGTSNGGAAYAASATKPTLAGSYSVVATLAADNNYEGQASAPFAFAIGKANQTITVATASPASAVYNTEFAVAATSTSGLPVAYTSSAPLSNIGATYKMNSGIGTGEVIYNQAGNDNYNAALEVKVNVAAAKADQTLTWYNPDNIVYGTALSATQLNASVAGVAGGYAPSSPTYDPELGTVLDAGSHTLSVKAAATDNYNEANNSVTLVVEKRIVTISPTAGQHKFCGQITDPVFVFSNDAGLAEAAFGITKLGRIAGENVNTYDFVLGSLSAGSNYTLSLDATNKFEIRGIVIDASASGTSVQIGSGTTLSASIKSTSGGNLQGVSVEFYVNGVKKGTSTTSDGEGRATLAIPASEISTVGLYKVEVKTSSGCTGAAAYFSVFDPTAGFVTGGGWIESPLGAYTVDKTAKGKANFGFNSQYKKGSNVPTGNTEFQFQAGNLNFRSTSYNEGSLVVAGTKAIYKGTGTINGSGNYGFMVSIVDGNATGGDGKDRFRMKIWEMSGTVVYDNQMGDDNAILASESTLLGGGSIVIHTPNVKSAGSSKLVAATALPESNTFINYPNPFNDRTTITFTAVAEESFALEVYDVKGALVKKVDQGTTEAGKTYAYEFTNRSMPEGVYFARLITTSGVKTLKMVLKR